MSYSIGDKIVYPMHGAGIIVDKVNKKIMDEIRCYFIVKSPISEMVAMLPVEHMDSIGIRDVMTNSEADNLLDKIRTM
ncbi:MAG: CarD family transcriptional regulator, partial [Clostridia bacterium]|nr:CarD family transcriptional regulator [Clostridia bacterium]